MNADDEGWPKCTCGKPAAKTDANMSGIYSCQRCAQALCDDENCSFYPPHPKPAIQICGRCHHELYGRGAH